MTNLYLNTMKIKAYLFCMGCFFGTLHAQERLTLSDAILLAQQNSHEAQVARFSFLGKHWSYRSYKAEWLPSLNFSGDLFNFDRSIVDARDPESGKISYVENNSLANRLNLSINQNLPWMGGTLSIQSGLARLDQFNYNLKTYNSEPFILGYTQPLNGYSSLKWRKKTEPLEYENAKRAYMEAQQNIIITITNLFFQALSAQSDYKQSKDSYKDLEEMFRIAQKRHKLGTTSKSEILQLELSLLNAKMNISKIRLTLENRIFNLFSFLRIQHYENIALIPPYSIPDVNIDLDQVIEMAYHNSTHSTTQNLNLLRAKQSLSETKANTGLQMKLHARVGLSQTAGTINSVYQKVKDNEVVGVTFSLPVYDWGLGKGKIRMAKAELELTKAQIEQANIDFSQSIRTKVLQFNNQSEQCSISQRALDIAEERYDIMKKRFENGAVTVTELKTAQLEFESAKNQHLYQLETFWLDYYSIQKLALYDFIRKQNITADFNELIK